jgi:hypothetical protein
MQNLTKNDLPGGKVVDVESMNERDFVRIAAASTGIAFGAMFAAIDAFHWDASGFAFRFSSRVVIAFVIGAIVGLFYWNLVSRDGARPSSLLSRAVTVVLLVGAFGACLYPLRYVSPETLSEVLQGLGTAMVALTFLGFILWRIKKSLDQDAIEHAVIPPAGNSPRPESRGPFERSLSRTEQPPKKLVAADFKVPGDIAKDA